MNINTNDLLLLNKIRFGEETGKPAIVSDPQTETVSAPQTGLNALMFQGLKNISENPQLALSLYAQNNAIFAAPSAEPTTANANEYVAPYSSNIAFQGKTSQIRNVVMSAVIGLTTLGALTSCSDDDYEPQPINISQEVSVNVDMTTISQMFAQMMAIYESMLEQQAITNAQLEANTAYLQQLLAAFTAGNSTANEFYAAMYSFMTSTTTNQEVIITLLTQNGMTQEKAVTLLEELIAKVEAGTLSAQEAMAQIIDKLSGIADLLSDIITTFTTYYDAMLAKQDELIETNKQGFEELLAQGTITNATLAEMNEKSDSLIVLSNKQIEAQNEIKEAIEDANLDSNANFSVVVSALSSNTQSILNALMKLGYTEAQIARMTASQIISALESTSSSLAAEVTAAIEEANLSASANFSAVIDAMSTGSQDLIDALMRLGYTQEQITNMTAAEIIAAIEENTAATEKGNEYLAKITSYVAILPRLYAEGTITNAKLQELYNAFLEIAAAAGDYSEEVLEKMEELLTELTSIAGTLEEIKTELSTLSSNFASFYEDYKTDRATEFGLLGEIIKNNKFQTDVLIDLTKAQKQSAATLAQLQANVTSFKELVSSDFDSVIEAIESIQSGGTTEIDYQELQAMFDALGITISQALKMSSSELTAAIEKFESTYLATEASQSAQLASINAKLDDLQYFNGLSKTEIIAAISALTEAVNNGNDDITAELEAIEEALDNLQAQLDSIYTAIGTYAAKASSYYEKWDAKFSTALSQLSNISSQLATIKANQTTAITYLKNLTTQVENVKTEIQNLQEALGDNSSSITLEELEALWEEHDAANYEKYSALIKNLGLSLDVNTATIETLLASIDAKMEYIQENSDILSQILDKLNGIDWTSTDYSDKLDKIIELLENFECNCQNGTSNEGIIGDLEDILG